jgi:hypothetical protein
VLDLLDCWNAYLVWRCLSCLARRVETWNFRYRRAPLMERSFHENSRQSMAVMITSIYRAVEGPTLGQTIYISRNTSIRTYLNFLRYDAHRIANGNVGYLDGTLEINLSSNTAPARLQRDFPSICISIMRPSEFPHCAAACCVCHVPHRVILEASAQSINYTHIKTNSTAQNVKSTKHVLLAS